MLLTSLKVWDNFHFEKFSGSDKLGPILYLNHCASPAPGWRLGLKETPNKWLTEMPTEI